MEGHKRKSDVSTPFWTRLLALFDRHQRLIQVSGRLVVIGLITSVAFWMARLAVGPDQPVFWELGLSMSLQHLLIYHLMGYWALPRLLYQRRVGWLSAWILLALLVAYSINRFVILDVTPSLPQAVRYINRIRALFLSTGWLGGLLSIQVLLWTFIISLFPPFIFLILKLVKDTLVFRQVRFQLQRSRLLLDRDNAALKLNFLKAQVSPHFLFNTLNSIYSQVIGVDDEAADLVLRLAELMRYNLYEASVSQVPLAREMDYLRSYIVLEQARHGDRLTVLVNADDDFSGYSIAPLLLITYVENAFKHGVKSGVEGAYVLIGATLDGSTLVFTVENSVSRGPTVTTRQKAGGVGLPNVQKRLALLYPNRHDVVLDITDQYYRVTLRLTLMQPSSAPIRPQPVS